MRPTTSAARFWARIFGINFVLGVVTGIPMEFQFGTNWSHFSRFAGGVIGQTLAMEGMFAFFLESAFLGLFLYGEKRWAPRHWWSAVAVFLGSWLQGFFIIATDAWMQHPVGYMQGCRRLGAAFQFLGTGAESVGVVAICAQHERRRDHRRFRHGVRRRVLFAVGQVRGVRPNLSCGSELSPGCVFSVLQLFPTGDGQGRMIAQHQPVTLAAMEALFESQPGAPLVLVGQPNVGPAQDRQSDPDPECLSFLTYRAWKAEVKGLNAFPADQWPTNIELLYFSYHIMVGLGTLFIAIMVIAALAAVARQTVLQPLDALDPAAGLAVPLHRQHCRLDHRGDRPPALAGVRA